MAEKSILAKNWSELTGITYNIDPLIEQATTEEQKLDLYANLIWCIYRGRVLESKWYGEMAIDTTAGLTEELIGPCSTEGWEPSGAGFTQEEVEVIKSWLDSGCPVDPGDGIEIKDGKLCVKFGQGLGIDSNGKLVCTGGGGGSLEYFAGAGIDIDSEYKINVQVGDGLDIVDNKIVCTASGAEYTAGANIQISDENVISATDTIYDDTEVLNLISGKANVGDSYTKAESDDKYLTEHQDISGKQDKLTAGANIQISDENVISATDTIYDDSGVRSLISGKANVGDSYTKAESDDKYLTEHQDISGKQDKLTAGANISISEDNVISATGSAAVEYTAGANIQISDEHVISASFTEEDPTVPTYVKSIVEDDINNWNSASVTAEFADIIELGTFIIEDGSHDIGTYFSNQHGNLTSWEDFFIYTNNTYQVKPIRGHLVNTAHLPYYQNGDYGTVMLNATTPYMNDNAMPDSISLYGMVCETPKGYPNTHNWSEHFVTITKLSNTEVNFSSITYNSYVPNLQEPMSVGQNLIALATDIDEIKETMQSKLTAGDGIVISDDNIVSVKYPQTPLTVNVELYKPQSTVVERADGMEYTLSKTGSVAASLIGQSINPGSLFNAIYSGKDEDTIINMVKNSPISFVYSSSTDTAGVYLTATNKSIKRVVKDGESGPKYVYVLKLGGDVNTPVNTLSGATVYPKIFVEYVIPCKQENTDLYSITLSMYEYNKDVRTELSTSDNIKYYLTEAEYEADTTKGHPCVSFIAAKNEIKYDA